MTVTISSAESEAEEDAVDADDDDDFAASTRLLRPPPLAEGLGRFDAARGTSYGNRANPVAAAAVAGVVPPGELWSISLSCVSATAPLFLMPATLTTEANNNRFMGRPLLRAMTAIFIALSSCAGHEQRTTCSGHRTMVDFRAQSVPKIKRLCTSYTNLCLRTSRDGPSDFHCPSQAAVSVHSRACERLSARPCTGQR